MRTEEEIIYTLHSIVRAGTINQDDSINERLMRRFLQIHRGKLLHRTFEQGATLPDEVFQNLGDITFSLDNENFISEPLPKTIQFKSNNQFKVQIMGFPISVVNSEEFHNAEFDQWNKNHPLIKMVGNRMHLRNGKPIQNQLENFSSAPLNQLIEILTPSFSNTEVSAGILAVLDNPDDEPGYDFTSSNYPLTGDLIEDLYNSVQARDFNIFLRMKSDNVGNLKDDTKPNTQQEDL